MAEQQSKVIEAKEKFVCSRCGREFNEKGFYKDKNGVIMKTCKGCISSKIDLNSPSTIYPVLKEIDIPYIPEEWNNLRFRYEYSEKNGQRVRNPKANQSILGRYIGKMKLKQFSEYSYSDTPRFIEIFEEGQVATRKRLHDKLDELIDEGYDVETFLQRMGGVNEDEIIVAPTIITTNEDGEKEIVEAEPPKEILTKEEIRDLRLKWGDPYIPEELFRLETFYGEMHDSYDITSASHEDYLKQICKLSLRMHSLIDNGMFDEYAKVSNAYDKMMKSAKFTASQEKEEDRFIDSIAEMVRLCEEQGFIPQYHDSENQDVVDVTLKDLENYTYNLVTTELNLDVLFDKGLEQIKLEEEKDLMSEDDALFYGGENSDEETFRDIEEEIKADLDMGINEEVEIIDGQKEEE